jgi:hypothetical protein
MAAEAGRGNGQGVSAETLMFFTAFGTDGSKTRDRAEAIYKKLLVPLGERAGLEVIKVDRSTEPGDIVDQTFRQLLECRLVVCDVSGGTPNVFYELGIIHSCNIPVVLLSDDSTELPFYIKHERVIVVRDGQDLRRKEVKEGLAEAVETVRSDAYAPHSAIGDALGMGANLPTPLREALRRSAMPLYREAMEYDLDVIAVGDTGITMKLGVSYRVVNQLPTPFNQVDWCRCGRCSRCTARSAASDSTSPIPISTPNGAGRSPTNSPPARRRR